MHASHQALHPVKPHQTTSHHATTSDSTPYTITQQMCKHARLHALMHARMHAYIQRRCVNKCMHACMHAHIHYIHCMHASHTTRMLHISAKIAHACMHAPVHAHFPHTSMHALDAYIHKYTRKCMHTSPYLTIWIHAVHLRMCPHARMNGRAGIHTYM